ncbi:MAG: alpha-mannosidase [Candidatus Omnitrophota bacterium]
MKMLLDRIQSRLKEFEQHQLMYAYKQSIEKIRYAQEPLNNPMDFSEKSGVWKNMRVGDGWPQFETYYWMHVPVVIPPSFAGQTIDLRIALSREYTLHTPEGLVYVNGELRHGIDRNHCAIRLAESAKEGHSFEVAIRVYTGEPYQFLKLNNLPPYQLAECSIAVLNRDAQNFFHLAKTLTGVILSLQEDSRLRWEMMTLLGDAFNRIDYKHPRSEEFYRSIRDVLRQLKQQLKTLDAPPAREKVTCIGHAHIDVAWLWTLRRTREKAVHTFSTVLDLMERHPDYRFFQSQPQLYQYVREENPALFQRILKRIKEGRWEADGGMWIESDCNLVSGESLVRQFLYGRRFFEEELKTNCSILWLPDAFGFNAALPQIMQKAEIPYFMTTKISWNQYNPMPHDTFRWRGLDGTEVLAHFINTPSGQWFKTYNGLLTPEEIQGTWRDYRQKDVSGEVLLAFGYGDGGGGPVEEMLLCAENLKNMPGFPQTEQGRADAFFQRKEKARDRMPVWEGELYLEYHRGTYTSQAQNKKFNREAELRMQQAEFVAALAALAGEEYPRDRFRAIWEKILLNQFHDIIPGSSIRQVYLDSADDYAWIQAETERIVAQSGKILAQRSQRKDEVFTLVNTLSWRRKEPFLIPLPDSACEAYASGGAAAETQIVETVGGGKWLLMEGAALPPLSASVFTPAPDAAPMERTLKAVRRRLENSMLRIEFNARGEIVSLYDKEAQREVLLPGQSANVFQAFEDKPIAHDAWDIDIFYQDKLLSTGDKAEMSVVEEGPLRATIRVKKTILDGTIEQNISLYRRSRRIDFDTRIEWVNKDVLLKAAFPAAIRAVSATYDIQFGNIQRSTHWNTSWDWARFESCAHKWVDLSEGDYGVSLMNTCKYGHDIRGNTIRLTCIKCAGAPDPLADVGVHHFTYSLYPHQGGWRDAAIPQRAYELNSQPLMLPGRFSHPMLVEGESFVSVDKEHVILETVKWAEKEDAVIVRLHEAYNQRGPVTLQFHRPPKKAAECNLLERQDEPIKIEGNRIQFFIKPYEIRTVKVKF